MAEIVLLHQLNELETTHFRHLNIRNDQVWLKRFELFQCLNPVIRRFDIMKWRICISDNRAKACKDKRFVIND
ncbi:hypothetical protein D3C78_1757970 [compost metagenome]